MRHIYLSLFIFLSFSLAGQKQILMSSQRSNKIMRYDVDADRLIQIKALEEVNDVELDEEAGFIFWADVANTNIIKYNLETKAKTTLLSNITDLQTIYLDKQNKILLFSRGDSTISSVSYEGAGRKLFLENIPNITQFAIDFTDNTLFYINQEENQLMKTDIDNFDPVLLAENARSVTQLILEEENETVYWIQTDRVNLNSGLRSLPYEGGEVNEIVTDFMVGGTIDFEDQKLYASDHFGRYRRYNLDGTEGTIIADNDFLFSAIDPKTNNIYAFSENEEFLLSLEDMGATVESEIELLRDTRIPKGFSLDTENDLVYGINGGQGFQNVREGSITSFNINGKNTQAIIANDDELSLIHI